MDFIVTGTAAYGPFNPDSSDLDIVLYEEDAIDLEDYLDNHGISVHNPGNAWHYNNGGYYFNLESMRFNIIVAENKQDFDKWKRRTEAMKKIVPIEDRDKRVQKFKSF